MANARADYSSGEQYPDTHPENEAGIEEEGPLDVLKPYKKKLLSRLQDSMPATAAALDMAIPDSVIGAAGTASRTLGEAAAVGKGMGLMSDEERGARALAKAEKLDQNANSLAQKIRSGESEGYGDKLAQQTSRELAQNLRYQGYVKSRPDLIDRAKAAGMKPTEIQDMIMKEVGNDPGEFEHYISILERDQ